MSEDQLIQGSPEWLQARVGSLGASRVHDALARTKAGWGASRANIAAELICERLTGCAQPSFTNAAMQWGTDQEPNARAAYVAKFERDVCEVGLIRHPEIAGTHASPDGLISEAGMLEIKCPNTATHLETLLSGQIAARYLTQMQWQMACAGREWCDFVSFDPRVSGKLQLFTKRVERDVSVIVGLESDVSEFLAEVEAKLRDLRALELAA